ncbi:hypothetical protein BDF21DRAFT_405881 [Thamnidium elegans]|nr:hypothetical protein BDF21DRAFT_405881 [Thamnidium elegans]
MVNVSLISVILLSTCCTGIMAQGQMAVAVVGFVASMIGIITSPGAFEATFSQKPQVRDNFKITSEIAFQKGSEMLEFPRIDVLDLAGNIIGFNYDERKGEEGRFQVMDVSYNEVPNVIQITAPVIGGRITFTTLKITTSSRNVLTDKYYSTFVTADAIKGCIERSGQNVIGDLGACDKSTYVDAKGVLQSSYGLVMSQRNNCELKWIQINMYETLQALNNNNVDAFCNGIKFEVNPNSVNGGTCNYCPKGGLVIPYCREC